MTIKFTAEEVALILTNHVRMTVFNGIEESFTFQPTILVPTGRGENDGSLFQVEVYHKEVEQ